MNDNQSKTCARCKQVKPVSAYARYKATKDGLQSYCRECFTTYRRERSPERTKRQWSIAELNELAVRTANLLVERGAIINEEIGEHTCLTVTDWREHFELDAAVWKKVQQRMLQMGFPLSFEEFEGFYLGGQGDQYSTIIFLLKRIVKMTETAFQRIESVQHSGRWPETQPRLQEALATWCGGITLETLPELLQAVGIRPGENFTQQLLILPVGNQRPN